MKNSHASLNKNPSNSSDTPRVENLICETTQAENTRVDSHEIPKPGGAS